MYNLKYYCANGKMINFAVINNLIITNADGLTANVANFAETQGIGQIGSTRQGQSVQPKNIVIEGEITGKTDNLRQRLLDTITPLENGRLYYNDTKYIDVMPLQTPDIQRKNVNAKFQFTLRAFFPYWRSANIKNTQIVGVMPMFHFPINYGNTYFENPLIHQFGRRTESHFADAHNAGNVPAPFTVLFIAKTDLSNPKITMVDTGEYIRIQRDMVAGERIAVDLTQNRLRVTQFLDGQELDGINYLDITSSIGMTLKTGENIIRYDADKNREGLDVRLIHHDTWAGAF